MLREGYDSCLFTDEERAFSRMLDGGAVLVGDRWFPAGTPEVERARYLVAYHTRLERNRRRRERRRAARGQDRPRNVRGHVAIDIGSQREHRRLLERSKCLRRATVARCPTANEIRTAWAYRRGGRLAFLRLGGLLLDLECFVDNSLKVGRRSGRPLIVGRSRGLLGWIRENCPELVRSYKTLMRIKAAAKNLRQNLDVPDPVPTALLIDPATAPAALADLPLHVQPRGGLNGDGDADGECGLVRNRFVWEVSSIAVDAKGRCFRYDENYRLVRHGADYCRTAARRLAALQREMSSILLNDKAGFAIEKYFEAQDRVPSRSPELAVERRRDRVARDVKEGGRKLTAGDLITEWLELPYRMTHLPTMSKWDLRNEW